MEKSNSPHPCVPEENPITEKDEEEKKENEEMIELASQQQP